MQSRYRQENIFALTLNLIKQPLFLTFAQLGSQRKSWMQAYTTNLDFLSIHPVGILYKQSVLKAWLYLFWIGWPIMLFSLFI